MKGWVKTVLLVAGIFLVVGTFYYLFFFSLFESTPAISRHSYLELNIYGDINDRAVEDPITKLFVGEMPAMDGLLHCIRKATLDPKIEGIIIRPYISSIGWAKVEELREALLKFRESGKPVYAYLEMAGNKEYYLATAADTIFGSPNGYLIIDGLAAKSYFLKGTLDKLGIQVDVVAHGKYKDAPNIFTRKSLSDPSKEVLNAILDDYYARYLSAIATARGLSKQEAARLIDYGLYYIRDAYEKHLVDTLLYYNEFKDYLKEKTGRRPRLVSYSRYRKIPFEKLGVKSKHTFALIYASGDIVTGIGDDLPQEKLIISEALANTIRKVAKNSRIKAIILRVDSPGGSGTASDIIWREVVEARKKKPVVVSISDMGASGGYYISMAANKIVAEPSSIVGSIGVFSFKFNFKGFYQKLGITKEELHRGENANMFSEYSNFTPRQRKIMQKNIDDFYVEFVSKVARSRGMTFEEVDRIAQGRVWTGKQGREIGLVDTLGGLQTAVNIAKRLVNIPEGEFVNVLVYPKKVSYLQRLLSSGIHARINRMLENIPLSLKLRRFLAGIFYWNNYEMLAVMPVYFEIE